MESKKKFEIALILSVAGLYFFSFFQRIAIPGSIFNNLQTDFVLQASSVTMLSSIYLLIYASMQPFAGFLADRFGGIKVVLVSGLLLCLGSFVFPASQNTWQLYLSRGLVGLGASAMYLCLAKETDHYFPGKNFAPVFGVMCLLGYSGGLIGTRPFRMLVEYSGWRNSCFVAAALTTVFLVTTFILMKKVGREDTVKKESKLIKGILSVLKNKLNYPLLLTTPLCVSIYLTLQATIGAKFLQDFCGFTPLQSTGYTFFMMFGIISAMLFSGILSRMLKNRRKCFFIFNSTSTVTSMTLLLCGTIFNWPPFVFLIAFVLSAVASGCTPVNVSCMKEMNHPERSAISIGVMNTWSYVMVAIMAQVVGFVLDFFKDDAIKKGDISIYPPSAYITLFSIFLGMALIAFVASLCSHETYGENIYVEKNDIEKPCEACTSE